MKSNDVLILPLDVTLEQSRNDCVRYVINMWGAVDILVNNAGICYRSVLEEMSLADERLQMETTTWDRFRWYVKSRHSCVEKVAENHQCF